MNINAVDVRGASIRDAVRRFAHPLLRFALQGLRWGAFGVLALLRPILIPVLSWLAVGGVLLSVIFVVLARDTEFPTLRVLGMSVGCAVGAVVYYAVMEWLVPGYLGRGR